MGQATATYNMAAKTFTDLHAWKHGHQLVLSTYKLSKNFPNDEIFGLTAQMRRAATSVTSNLAEGFSRRSSKDKSRFYSMALGSLTELQSQIIISKDLHYINEHEAEKLGVQSVLVHKLINGLIKSTSSLNS